LSHWCVFHRKRAKALAPVWQKELRAAPGKRKLSFLYLANDVLQNSRKKGSEWIEALWPKMEWAMKHTLRATSDEKTAKSCAKLVKVWLDRRIFGSRSLEGWLDASAGVDDADAAAASDAAAADAAAAAAARAPLVVRRKEERLTEIPAALTGKNAALAKALEAAEKAIAALKDADATCAADLRDDVVADGFVDTAADPEDAKRKIQAAESALAARREALEESSRLRTEAARLAREVCEAHEAAAASESEALEASAGVAVKVATLRMKATKRAAAAMAVAAAAEAAGVNKSRPGLEPPPTAAVAQTAPDANHEPPEEEYVPEPTAGEEEYVPEEVPQEGAAPDLEQLLAAGASDPEVLAQALAALPADQREAFEAQLQDAGVM
jgi:regulator of Ty1 transposition protein 103